MMKRLSLVLLSLGLISGVLLLSGCGKPVDLSREETQAVWKDTISSRENGAKLIVSDQTKETLKLRANTDSALIQANMDFSFSTEIDAISGQSISYNLLKGRIMDLQKLSTIDFNVDYNTLRENNLIKYVRLNSAKIDMGDNNVATIFSQDIANAFSGKRIYMDVSSGLVESAQIDFQYAKNWIIELQQQGFMEFLHSYPIFSTGTKTKYNKKIAYRITLNEEMLKQIVSDFYRTGSDISEGQEKSEIRNNIQADAYLVVRKENKVDLVIDKLYNKLDPSVYAKITLSERVIDVHVYDEEQNIESTISLVNMGLDHYDIHITIMQDEVEMFSAQGNIVVQIRDGVFVLEFNLTLYISQINQFLSRIQSDEQTIRVDIQGEYYQRASYTGFSVSIPTEYLLLSHIFSDQFGMENILGNNESLGVDTNKDI